MVRLHMRVIAAVVLVSFVCWPIHGYALPEGASPDAGSSVSQPDGVTFNVDQTADRTIINYTGFDIAAGETVNFIQPNSSMIALNRVAEGNPSDIFGTINAGARIFILNPSGILFGAGSQVNAAGLVASTLALSDDDFKDGNNSFYFYRPSMEGPIGGVENRGLIQKELGSGIPGAFVGLLGPQVIN